MKERPILFSGAMVRALLAGTKTQTRRVAIKTSQPHNVCLSDFDAAECKIEIENRHSGLRYWKSCPYGKPGDRLWVRETFCKIIGQSGCWIETDYSATYNHGFRLGDTLGLKKRWTPSIHMPRAASRLTLEITSVRVERLQDISEADAIAEGIERLDDFLGCPCYRAYDEPQGSDVVFPDDPIGSYASLWTSINGPGSWDANPWVWALEFRRIEAEGGAA